MSTNLMTSRVLNKRNFILELGTDNRCPVYIVDYNKLRADVASIYNGDIAMQDNVQNTITAYATGGRTNATALEFGVNNITTCATAHDSVMLPDILDTSTASYDGEWVTVYNNGATTCDVYTYLSGGVGAGTINGLAAAAKISIPAGGILRFTAIASNTWITEEVLYSTAPTAANGMLKLVAANMGADYEVTITNATQAASRTYTIPDAGASASFVMTEGAATINGIKTFGSGVVLPAGTVGTPSLQVGSVDTGFYQLSASQTGFSQDGVLVGVMDSDGFTANSFRNRIQLGTTPVGTVSVVEYGDSKDITTVLTLTDFVVGALAGAGAALGMGNIIYAYPAGQHLELVSSFSDIVLTAAGTAVTTDTGLGSVIGSGVVSVLSGTATFEDRLTGQAIDTDPTGGAAVSALAAATAGIGTGISLNVAASIKNVFLNAAGTWNANNTGNLTATGTIILKWTKMS